jgi:putative transposase
MPLDPSLLRPAQDGGPEFIANAVQKWLAKIGVKALYITLGSPWDNGYCESFNGSMRDEFLNGEIFSTLAEAQILIEAWGRHYNTVRPHSSLRYRPPAPETATPPWLPSRSAPLRSNYAQPWRQRRFCTNNQHGRLGGGRSFLAGGRDTSTTVSALIVDGG